jgi:hypothetical protein
MRLHGTPTHLKVARMAPAGADRRPADHSAAPAQASGEAAYGRERFRSASILPNPLDYPADIELHRMLPTIEGRALARERTRGITEAMHIAIVLLAVFILGLVAGMTLQQTITDARTYDKQARV